MALNDPLANVLSHLQNIQRLGKSECTVRPASNMVKAVLELFQTNGYIGEFKEVQDGKGNMFKVSLLGKINLCGVVKPRYAVKKENFEKFEKRFLPASNFGSLIVSTSQGVMTHTQAKEKNIGGKLIAFVY